MRGRDGNDVLALSGTDFHDQRIAVAPGLADTGLVEHESVAHVERPLARVDLQQIGIGIGIPCALQTRIEPCGTSHERQHLASVQRWPAVGGRLRVPHVFVCSMAINRRVFVLLHTLIYRGNTGANRLCAFVFACYTQIVQKVTNSSKSEQWLTFSPAIASRSSFGGKART